MIGTPETPVQRWFSRQDSVCIICNQSIGIGAEIRPLQKQAQLGPSAQPLAKNLAEHKDAPKKKNAPLCWVHGDCIDVALRPRGDCSDISSRCGRHPKESPQGVFSLPPCKHFSKTGKCAFGRNCAFIHDCAVEAATIDRNEETQHQRRTWGGRRRHVSNDFRVSAFRLWALKKFAKVLRAERGTLHEDSTGSLTSISTEASFTCNGLSAQPPLVLDIAGGKGELGFELAHLSGIPTMIIEPRVLELGKFERKWNLGLYHRPRCTGLEIAAMDDTVPSPWLPAGIHRSRLSHLRAFFDLDLADALLEDQNNLNLFVENLHKARTTRWTRKGLEAGHEAAAGEGHTADTVEEHGTDSEDKELEDDGQDINKEVPEYVENRNFVSSDRVLSSDRIERTTSYVEVSESVEASHLLRAARLVLGMHPDQPTGAIVDFALKYRKPFAVVPCCVHFRTFPKRKLRDGSFVNTYDKLIQWLVERSPDIQVEELNFGGRNKVVYWLGDR